MTNKTYVRSMPEVEQCSVTNKCAILNGMEQHEAHMLALQDMLSVLRERQSAWDLTSSERKRSKEGIEALEAAAAALSIQVYA